jgi:hypothetical protein
LHVVRAALLATAVITSLIGAPAHAVEAVNVRLGVPVIDLGDAVEWHAGDNGRLQITAAPDARDIVRRIEVRAYRDGAHWAVFALANTRGEPIERLIVVPRDQMVNIASTPGGRADRQDSATADIFRVTLDPGAIVTFVAELHADPLPHIYLWERNVYGASHDR